MGNLWSQPPKRPDRQILTPEYIRRLIDRHYGLYDLKISILQITTFLQNKYSKKITFEMVEEALYLNLSDIHLPQINRQSLLYA
jgi:hypothetical protein